MNQASPKTLRSITFNSQLLGQLVSDFKTDTLDIFNQSVGIVLDDFQRFLLVGFLNLKG